MLYNVYIRTQINSYYLNGFSENHVKKIVEAFNNNASEVFVKGLTIYLSRLLSFSIFDTSKSASILTSDEIDLLVNKEWRLFHRGQKNIDVYKHMGNNVTDDFGVGESKPSQKSNSNSVYINLNRLGELSQIQNNNFDLTKLMCLCNEVNDNLSRGNYFATGALVRAIIDHIPPIFSCNNFNEVANNYKAKGTAKSFSDSMKNLNESMRKISDKLLHAQITNKEALPNDTQVDCKRDLDVLLEEIIRILK